jgi:hypothetical protein
MEKMHRKKTVLKSEITSMEENENVERSEDGRKTNKHRGLRQFVNHKEDLQNYEDSYKNKKRPTNHDEDCYIDSREQKYSNNKMRFTNYNVDNQYDDYREQQYYEDEPHENLQFVNNKESSEQNQYIDPREQQCYNKKHYTRNFSEQGDGDQFPHLRRQRQLYDTMKEDPDIHPSDLRLSPTRGGRIYSQYPNENRENVYIHIKDRKQYLRHTYDNFDEESDCDYREELKSDNQSISSQQVGLFLNFFSLSF